MSIEYTSLPPEIPTGIILDGLTFLSEPAVDQWRHEQVEPAPTFLARFMNHDADPALFTNLSSVLQAHGSAEMDDATWATSGDSFKEQTVHAIIKARGIGHALKPENDIEAHEWLLEGSRRRLAVLSVRLAARRNPDGKRSAALREEFDRVSDVYWDVQCRMAERSLREAQTTGASPTQQHLHAYRLASGEFRKLVQATDAVAAVNKRRFSGKTALRGVSPHVLSQRVNFNDLPTEDGSLEAVRSTFYQVLGAADEAAEARFTR